MTETQTGSPATQVSHIEKLAVIGVFGVLAGICLYKGNFEAATGFATAIGTYAMAREGV